MKVKDPEYHYKLWLKIRDTWMIEQQEICKSKLLKCAICGKDGLDPFTEKLGDLATIDHILPVSKYPDLWREPTNFQVACNKCNNKKGNKVKT